MFEAILTIKQNCRRCFTCVRDCPAKAIKIVEGQASVVPDRCIACGNCTVVCSQDAKIYANGLIHAEAILRGDSPVAILLAPSFPAEFPGSIPGRIVSALKTTGVAHVVEVAYGADLVSRAYRDFLDSHPEGPWIGSSCPAIIEYVRKYQPNLTDRLVPIVSPMIATALAVKALYGDETRCIFVGPCIAKKLEARDPSLPRVVDEVLTFKELKALLDRKNIQPAMCDPLPFDPPRAGIGRAFPLSGGLLKSARLEVDLLDTDIVTISGQHEVASVLSAAARREIAPYLIEPLMCRGCHDGPGMSSRDLQFNRQDLVKQYVNTCRRETEEPVTCPVGVDLGRTYRTDDHRLKEPTEQEIRNILALTNKFTVEDELNCRACGYDTCRAKAIAVYHGLAEEAMCLPFMIEQAERVCHELGIPWGEIRQVHRHLINTEKLASMGQLAAGVAHELNNPLGTILLYTNLLQRKMTDRTDLAHDLALLTSEANRCKKIVGGLLDFARQNRIRLETANVAALLRQCIDTACPPPILQASGIRIVLDEPSGEVLCDLDRDQMAQVFVNLLKNAREAMEAKGGEIRVSAETLPDNTRVRIAITDQGCGIPQEDQERIFQPFFTTKGIGKGVGLGLPICYGIVKMHYGTIWCQSDAGSGTTFYIELPKTQAMAGRSILS